MKKIKAKKSFIIVINKYVLPLIFSLFTIFLLIFSKQNLQATKNGILLWANSVLPALFPFFIATELLKNTRVIDILGKVLNKVMRPLFNVPGIGAFPFFMGIISGYPVGAKIVSQFREENLLSKEEAERLLAFTNNSGPLFIVGTVGISLFGDYGIGMLLLLTHILACITVGIIFRAWKRSKKVTTNNFEYSSKSIVTISNLGDILKSSIMNSINTIVMIGGFVVLFSVIISILNNSGVLQHIENICTPLCNFFNIPNKMISGIFTGILEITNGINIIANINIKNLNLCIITSAFLVGFGGISVLLQVFSVISKSDISIKPYIYGKLLQGIFAAIYTFVLINFFPFFSMSL